MSIYLSSQFKTWQEVGQSETEGENKEHKQAPDIAIYKKRNQIRKHFKCWTKFRAMVVAVQWKATLRTVLIPKNGTLQYQITDAF